MRGDDFGNGGRPYYSPGELATDDCNEPCLCVPIGETRLTKFDPRCRVHFPRRSRR